MSTRFVAVFSFDSRTTLATLAFTAEPVHGLTASVMPAPVAAPLAAAVPPVFALDDPFESLPHAAAPSVSTPARTSPTVRRVRFMISPLSLRLVGRRRLATSQ